MAGAHGRGRTQNRIRSRITDGRGEYQAKRVKWTQTRGKNESGTRGKAQSSRNQPANSQLRFVKMPKPWQVSWGRSGPMRFQLV